MKLPKIDINFPPNYLDVKTNKVIFKEIKDNLQTT